MYFIILGGESVPTSKIGHCDTVALILCTWWVYTHFIVCCTIDKWTKKCLMYLFDNLPFLGFYFFFLYKKHIFLTAISGQSLLRDWLSQLWHHTSSHFYRDRPLQSSHYTCIVAMNFRLCDQLCHCGDDEDVSGLYIFLCNSQEELFDCFS